MPWSYDEYGFPVYFDDGSGGGEFRPEDYGYGGDQMLYAGGNQYFNEMDPALNDIYWGGINLEDPAIRAMYGLTDADFLPQQDPSQYAAGNFGSAEEANFPTTVSNEQLMALYDAGVRDFGGLDLTDEQMVAIREAGLTTDTSVNAPGFWQKVIGGAGSLAGGAAGLANTLVGAFGSDTARNLMTLGTMGAGLGAAGAALFADDPDPMKVPDFTAPAQLSPEQHSLLGYVQSQAGREEQLAQTGFPVQQGILELTRDRLPGLRDLAAGEETARMTALGNIQAGLETPPDPNAYPEEYEQWLQNAQRAEELMGQALSTEAMPGAYAEREAQKLRNQFTQRMIEAYGPGYTTSVPSMEKTYTEFEPAITDKLAKDAQARKAQELSMLTGVSAPRFAQAEQARAGQFGRGITAQQAQMQQYQGLDTTSDVLAKMTATAGAAAPTGAAERGLGALTGIRDKQQDLLNSIYQFNANLQNQKNQNLWQFAGTAMGGGLYGMRKASA